MTNRVRLQALTSVLLIAAGFALFGAELGGGPARAGAITQMPVTAMDQIVSPANNSPTVVADPEDPSFVALASRLDAPDFSCALHVSGDGGQRWTPVTPVPNLPPGAEKCYGPEIAFDSRGRLFYLFVGLAGAGNEPMGVYLTRSDDRGRTFSNPQQILGPLKFAVRMAMDPERGRTGRLHLVWIDAGSDPLLGGFGAPPNPIVAAHSDDGGRKFSRPVPVSDPQRERVVAPALDLGPGGEPYVSFFDLKRDALDYHGLEGPVYEGTWSVVATRSANGGRTFGRNVEVDSGVVPHERVMLILTMAPPGLAVGENGVCTAWTDGRFGDADVLARCSTDDGANWGKPTRLNDDRRGNGKWQFMPRLAASSSGRIDAVFYDRRADPRNLFQHVFYTHSTDDGASFSPNLKVTNDPSFARIGQQYGNPSAEGKFELGSRMGLLSHTDRALAAWADTRNSKPQSKGQDVFSANVSVGGESGFMTPKSVTGLVLAAIGVAGLAAVWLGDRQRQPGPPA